MIMLPSSNLIMRSTNPTQQKSSDPKSYMVPNIYISNIAMIDNKFCQYEITYKIDLIFREHDNKFMDLE